MAFRKRNMTDVELKEWMDTQYDINENGCWIWKGHKNTRRYAEIQYKKKSVKVHRLYWCLSGRTIPEGLHMLHGHGCSTACYNPEHLTPGTPVENALDRHRDGTMRQAKLTREQVLEMRAEVNKSTKELAEKYNVSISQIKRIISGERWTWLT